MVWTGWAAMEGYVEMMFMFKLFWKTLRWKWLAEVRTREFISALVSPSAANFD